MSTGTTGNRKRADAKAELDLKTTRRLIHFVPWKSQETSDFTQKTEKWKQFAANQNDPKYWEIVFWGGEADGVTVNSEVMSRLSNPSNPFDQIYIHGHGQVGKDSITSGGERRSDGELLYAREVARRLKKMGLPQYFRGMIKCWSCHSGEGGKKAVYIHSDKRWSGLCFAQALAENLYFGNDKNGGGDYTGVQVFGYLGMVLGSPEDDVCQAHYGHRITADVLVKDREKLRYKDPATRLQLPGRTEIATNDRFEKTDPLVKGKDNSLGFYIPRGRGSANRIKIVPEVRTIPPENKFLR